MDPQSQKFKITFDDQGSVGFKYFFRERDALEFLSSRPLSLQIIKLEQYDRKTNSFESFVK